MTLLDRLRARVARWKERRAQLAFLDARIKANVALERKLSENAQRDAIPKDDAPSRVKRGL